MPAWMPEPSPGLDVALASSLSAAAACSRPRIATAWSTAREAAAAVDGAFGRLVDALGERPDLLIVAASASFCREHLGALISRRAGTLTLHGATACHGVLIGQGKDTLSGHGLGFWGLVDPGGAFGVGARVLSGDPWRAGVVAVQEALQSAARPGEVPGLLWLTSPPGMEEAIMRGIDDYFGCAVPYLSVGSAGPNGTAGGRQIAGQAVHRDAVVVGVHFPSSPVTTARGYEEQSAAHGMALTLRDALAASGQPPQAVAGALMSGAIGGTAAGSATLRDTAQTLAKTLGGAPFLATLSADEPSMIGVRGRQRATAVFATRGAADEG